MQINVTHCYCLPDFGNTRLAYYFLLLYYKIFSASLVGALIDELEIAYLVKMCRCKIVRI